MILWLTDVNLLQAVHETTIGQKLVCTASTTAELKRLVIGFVNEAASLMNAITAITNKRSDVTAIQQLAIGNGSLPLTG